MGIGQAQAMVVMKLQLSKSSATIKRKNIIFKLLMLLTTKENAGYIDFTQQRFFFFWVLLK